MSNSGESCLLPDCSRISPMVHWVIQNLRGEQEVSGQWFSVKESRHPNPVSTPRTHHFTQTSWAREREGVLFKQVQSFHWPKKVLEIGLIVTQR